jgi:hypothetical protein
MKFLNSPEKAEFSEITRGMGDARVTFLKESVRRNGMVSGKSIIHAGPAILESVSESREKIVQADECRRDGVGLHDRWPTDDQWHALASFVEIGLVSARGAAGTMSSAFEFLRARQRSGFGISGKDDKRVVG